MVKKVRCIWSWLFFSEQKIDNTSLKVILWFRIISLLILIWAFVLFLAVFLEDKEFVKTVSVFYFQVLINWTHCGLSRSYCSWRSGSDGCQHRTSQRSGPHWAAGWMALYWWPRHVCSSGRWLSDAIGKFCSRRCLQGWWRCSRGWRKK